VAEWLRRGLQILTISTDQHTSHSKVPVKESIVLKFILQVLSVGYWWATAEILLSITHSQPKGPTTFRCSLVSPRT